jgi:hypothetical protein
MASTIKVNTLDTQSGTEVALAATKKITGDNTQFKITGGASANVLTTDGAGALTWGAPAAKVLQVLQAKKTDTSTSTSTTYVDISGLSQAITPASASSKFLVTMSLQGNGTPAVNFMLAQIVRDSTSIAIGDTAGSRVRATSGGALSHLTGGAECMTVSWIDEPATASAVTYKVQCAANDVGTFYINRTSTDTDSANFSRYVSTLTVMEIGA